MKKCEFISQKITTAATATAMYNIVGVHDITLTQNEIISLYGETNITIK